MIIEDVGSALSALQTVLNWLDTQDQWRAAINVSQAITSLEATPPKGLIPAAMTVSDLCH
jgi:cytochrome c-type biogenesis protein CcmH/NrfG